MAKNESLGVAQGTLMQQQIVAPPNQGVSQFAMSITAAEFLLTLGQTRMAVLQDEKGQHNQTAIAEWIMTLSMSPTSGKMLSRILAATVDSYEKTFGKIPEDPKGNVDVKTGYPSADQARP